MAKVFTELSRFFKTKFARSFFDLNLGIDLVCFLSIFILEPCLETRADMKLLPPMTMTWKVSPSLTKDFLGRGFLIKAREVFLPTAASRSSPVKLSRMVWSSLKL